MQTTGQEVSYRLSVNLKVGPTSIIFEKLPEKRCSHTTWCPGSFASPLSKLTIDKRQLHMFYDEAIISVIKWFHIKPTHAIKRWWTWRVWLLENVLRAIEEATIDRVSW